MKRELKISKLLDALDAWRVVDNDVADNGWTRENEGAWDDAKARMIALADEVRNVISDNGDNLGWCYLCEDSENRENIAYPQFFRTLAEAKKALRSGYREDCKMFGKDDLCKDETRISKDGMTAQLQTIVDVRLIRYSITKIAFEHGL